MERGQINVETNEEEINGTNLVHVMQAFSFLETLSKSIVTFVEGGILRTNLT